MIRAVFHIGTNKTGSSAIQKALATNPKFLASQGFIYPVATRGSDAGHHTLAELCTDYDDMYDAIVAIESEYATAGNPGGMIFSSEVFHTVEPFMLSRIFRGYEVQIVVFLRPHLEYYSSWYREGIKSHNFAWTFPEFFNCTARPYFSWLDTWSRAFGRDSITPILYDRSRFNNNSSTNEFFSKVFPEAENIPHEQISEENPSISGNLLHLKRLINKNISIETAHDIVYSIWEASELDPSFRGPWKMPDEYVDLVSSQFYDDQEIIFEEYGIDLSTPEDPKNAHISPDFSRIEEDKELIMTKVPELREYLEFFA